MLCAIIKKTDCENQFFWSQFGPNLVLIGQKYPYPTSLLFQIVSKHLTYKMSRLPNIIKFDVHICAGCGTNALWKERDICDVCLHRGMCCVCIYK